MNIVTKLAELSIKNFNGTIPPKTTKMVIQAIIDQYGLQIGGSGFPWSQSLYSYIKNFSQDQLGSTITYFGDSVSPPQAAFLNGCLGHAQDFDDSHQEAQTHPGSVVIPAAVAMGEYLNSSGEEVVKAITIGMEAMLRLAHSLCPACIEGGHHTPPTVGPFGSAIACGLLLGLTTSQLTNALGICGSYSGGLVEYTLSGGSVKRIHTGLGARNGMEAALLAQSGITGPNTIIEGKKGMWAIYGRGNAYPDRLLKNFGNHYLLDTLMFKPFNCCYLIHPAIEAFMNICSTESICVEQIASVKVGLSKFSISHAGKIILPTDELGAQFSTSFTLALSLIKGVPGMWSYTEEVLNDKRIRTLAEKISVYEDKETNDEFPQKNGCILTVNTCDGKAYIQRIKDPKGSPQNLLMPEEVKDKFLKNTIPIIGESSSEIFYERLQNIRGLKNIRDLSPSFKNHLRDNFVSNRLFAKL